MEALGTFSIQGLESRPLAFGEKVQITAVLRCIDIPDE